MIESLEADRYNDLYQIVLPYLTMDKHDDEDISATLLITVREAGFEAIGKAWPTNKHKATQGESLIGWLSKRQNEWWLSV